MYCELFLEFLCNFYSIKLKFFWIFSTPSIQNLFSNSKVISQMGDQILKFFYNLLRQYLEFVLNFERLFLQNFSEFSHHHFSKIFSFKIIWNGWHLTRPIIWMSCSGNCWDLHAVPNLFSRLKLRISQNQETSFGRGLLIIPPLLLAVSQQNTLQLKIFFKDGLRNHATSRIGFNRFYTELT